MTRQFRCLVLGIVLLVAFAQVASAQVQTGTPPFGSYAGSPDIVNLGNLNAHWDVPIFAKPGRGGFNFTYDLAYDTSVWNQVNNNGTLMWEPVANWGWAGQTQVETGYVVYTTTTQPWCLQGGQYYGQQWNYSWAYVDAFGVQHSFPGTTYTQNGAPAYCNPSSSSMTSTTFDGSGWTISITSGNAVQYVQSRSATIMHPPVQSSAGAGSAIDKNGNEITVNSSGQFFDTTSSTSSALTVSGTNPLTFAYPAPSGTAQFKVIYTAQTVQTNFQCPNIQDYPATSTNLVSEIDLPDGPKYTFTYEATPGVSGAVTGRLKVVTLPTGGSITYTYSGGNAGIMCADGSTAGMTRAIYDGTNTNTWTYTRSGTIPLTTTNITDPQGNLTSIQFSGIYETQRQVNQLVSGAQTLLKTLTTCYNGATSACAGASVSAPISQRNVTNQLGSGGPLSLTVFMYNGAGFVTEEDDYDFPSGTTLLRKTFTSYVQYSNGNIVPQTVTVCTPGGLPPSSYCNNSGSVAAQTVYGYDATAQTPTSGTPQHVSVGTAIGNLTGITAYTGPTTYLSKTITYFDTGNIQTISDVNNGQTTFSYGACGNSYVTNVSEPLGLSRSMNWNCTGGVETSVTDENSQNITTSYTDAYYWRPASVADQTNAVTSYCYGLLSGSTCSLNPNQVETVLSINPSSAVDTLTTNDGLGRVHLQQERQAPGSTTFDTVETDYDQLGRTSRVTVPYTAGAGQTNSSVAATVTSYDPLSRPTQMSDPGNGSAAGSVSYSYPLNDVVLAAWPAPSGEHTKSRQLEFDGLGRLTSVCEITGVTGSGTCAQASSQAGYWTRYTLDTLGDVLTITQNAQASSGQQTRNFRYDFLSRLTSEANAESGTTSYTYDSDSTCGTYNGDRVKRVDAVGNATCFAYDALHRITSATYSGPYASNTPNKYFIYDSATVNGVSMTLAKTRLAEAYTATSQTGSKITDEGFSYSGRGELSDIYESTPHSGGYYHLNQTYWGHGMPSQLSGNIGLPTLQYGGAIGSTVGLDGEGRVTFVTASSGQNPVTGVSFNSASLPMQVNFGSGDTDVFAYDPALRTNQFQSNVGGKTNTGALTWNANSTLQQLTISDPFNGANNQTCNYGYDDLMRLTNANCGTAASQTFSYDPFGNIQKSGSPYSFQPNYSSSTNRMTGLPGNITPTYDNNGNSTYDSNHSYAWDADGNSVTIDGVGLTFDALDRAVEKNNAGTYTEIAYSPTGAKLALMSGASLQKAFVMLPGQAQAVYTSSGLTYYRHSDWLGSYRLSSTSAGVNLTPGTGSVTVTSPTNGVQSKTVQTQAAASGWGTVTIIAGYTDRTTRYCPCPNGCGGNYSYCWQTVYDSGTISITINNVTAGSTSYGSGSSPSGLTTALISSINGNGNSPATAALVSGTNNEINLTAKAQGAGTNYSFVVSSYTTNSRFTGTSFPVSQSGSAFTGGQNAAYTTIYDSGKCTITVNGHPDSVNYSGSGTTTATIAQGPQGFVSTINGDSGAYVTAQPDSNSSKVDLAATSNGAGSDYSLSSSNPCTYDTTNFSQPSFSTTNSGPTLSGGTTATTMYADTAYAPFGESYAQAGATDLSFTGENQDTVGGEYDFLAREYSTEGRWPSPDPAGLAAVDITNPQSWNRYSYVVNNPLAYIDPTGLCDPNTICVVVVFCNGVNTYAPECLSVTLQPWLNSASNFACLFWGGCANSQARNGGGGGFTLGIRAPGQTFNQCLIANAKNYSAGGIADLTGLTSVVGAPDLGTSTVGQIFAGNTFTGAYAGLAGSFEDLATTAGTSTPDLLNSAIGSTTTFGRRTSNILALNLAGKGGLPQALSSSSGGLKSLLGIASKAFNLGLEASVKAAIDAGLAGAEVIGCLVPR